MSAGTVSGVTQTMPSLKPATVMSNALVMGYANLSEPAIEEGVRRLAAVLEEL